MSIKAVGSGLLASAQAFVDRKYTTRADARQREMGLAYVEAERQDLAREIASFAQQNGIEDKLNQLAADGRLHGFTLWKCPDHWQANMQTGASAGWRCMRGATPGEAIRKVLDMDYVDAIDDALGEPPLPIMTRSEADFAEAALADVLAEEGDEPPAGDDEDSIFG
ncbi:hypothetical protein [Rhodopseudomonas pseudopalustris]|uniref:Uncharacterized protein n=1 Tax=Rhodopseudomonas pseudopalustris TaxID=1513892 RepID=A0A1H8WH30_9BRAD|nr:hypothetical protein [Rhodopseudomonas pseudopalustris]SEP26984.1 hypothetical protein SAMN05444123_11290 [Rhodopseudomonas pseudopalustris]